MQQPCWAPHCISDAILRKSSHAGLNFPRMQFEPTVRCTIKWMGHCGSDTALRMVHLWTLSHRFSLNSDFISRHHHELYSWAVIQLPGWSHNTCKYELKAATPQDYREFADALASVKQGPSNGRWERTWCSQQAFLPLAPLALFGAWQSLTSTQVTSCTLHTLCTCKVKDVQVRQDRILQL